MELYVHISDSESNNIFNDNRSYHFKVQLKLPLHFDGYWKVALCEISIHPDPNVKKKDLSDHLFIYSNICQESIVNGVKQTLLRRIEKNTRDSWNYVFDSPFYFPLKKSEIQELEISIKTADGELASFVTSPVHLTLHFKRYPFYPSYESI